MTAIATVAAARKIDVNQLTKLVEKYRVHGEAYQEPVLTDLFNQAFGKDAAAARNIAGGILDCLKPEPAPEKGKGHLYCKVSEKGGLSVYGLQRMPVTLYVEQWERLLAFAGDIGTFITANNGKLKRETAEQRAERKAAAKSGETTPPAGPTVGGAIGGQQLQLTPEQFANWMKAMGNGQLPAAMQPAA